MVKEVACDIRLLRWRLLELSLEDEFAPVFRQLEIHLLARPEPQLIIQASESKLGFRLAGLFVHPGEKSADGR